jgi:hypothetical protein
MTPLSLIEYFDERRDQWHQRWSTFVLDDGSPILKFRDSGHIEHWPSLSRLNLERHPGFWRMSRLDWYAKREPGYDAIDLFLIGYGNKKVDFIRPSEPAYDVFSDLFRHGDGFLLRPCEVVAAEREADDVRSAERVPR